MRVVFLTVEPGGNLGPGDSVPALRRTDPLLGHRDSSLSKMLSWDGGGTDKRTVVRHGPQLNPDNPYEVLMSLYALSIMWGILVAMVALSHRALTGTGRTLTD